MGDKRVKQALAAAERICRERGVRLTETRRRVLELILEAGQPIGAYGLLGRLSGQPMPTTVYRAIDFLLAQQFVHRIESLNAFVACLDSDHPHESQFVICSDCGSTEELHDEAIVASIRRHGRSLGFKIDSQVVEVRGICAACQGVGR
jgi:Fur family transcriptional regulator, zinc uptake regulator